MQYSSMYRVVIYIIIILFLLREDDGSVRNYQNVINYSDSMQISVNLA